MPSKRKPSPTNPYSSRIQSVLFGRFVIDVMCASSTHGISQVPNRVQDRLLVETEDGHLRWGDH